MRVLAGPEKRARLLSEQERKITAYHEMGHALVGHFLEHEPGSQDHDRVARPGPRPDDLAADGRSVSAVAQRVDGRPCDDAQGRAAEARVPRDHDGRRKRPREVTSTAKAMIMRYGMSEKLGPRVLGRNQDMPFLRREMGHEPDYSDEVAREIDEEIRRVIEGHDRATASSRSIRKRCTRSRRS